MIPWPNGFKFLIFKHGNFDLLKNKHVPLIVLNVLICKNNNLFKLIKNKENKG